MIFPVLSQHKELEQSLIHPVKDYNPDLPIDEQTTCIPYDPKWEFPKKRLRQGNTPYCAVCILCGIMIVGELSGTNSGM